MATSASGQSRVANSSPGTTAKVQTTPAATSATAQSRSIPTSAGRPAAAARAVSSVTRIASTMPNSQTAGSASMSSVPPVWFTAWRKATQTAPSATARWFAPA